MQGNELSYTDGGNEKLYKYSENCMALSYKPKHRLTIQPRNYTPGFSFHMGKNLGGHTKTYAWIFIAASILIPKPKNKLNVSLPQINYCTIVHP